jgi:hypothetical protein
MIHLVRIGGVAWVGALCFIFAFAVSSLMNKITPSLDKTKPKWITFLEVATQFAIIGAIVYASRLFIKNIPFPFDGAAGYIHSQLGELRTLPLMVFIFMFFQTKTQDKMRWLIN